MKLTDIRPVIESSGQMEEQLFSIGDPGIVFDILRSKMYSNPILAIARELSSNARDAHREVGTPDLPIQIVLPNQLDQNYRIKDWGPGISPDRIENIYVKYGASTKREDNIQSGFWGMGSKTPFSFTNSFAVITTHNHIKYQYACYIDETKVGKLALLSQEETQEPNGTEIVIPVEPKDAHFFTDWTEHACRHWTVKPTIKGGTIAWQMPTIILEGKDWAIAKSDSYVHEAIMIIDGIEYPLSMQALRTYGSTHMIDSCRGTIMMYFGIGELSLSANREQLYLDKKTQEKITQRFTDMQTDIKSLLDAKINNFPNLWQANVYFNKELTNTFSDLKFLGELRWKDIKLSKWLSIVCPAFSFSRGKYRKYGVNPNKITRSYITSIHFEENSQIFVMDLPIKEPTPRHVKKAFEDDPKLQSIQVLCPTDTTTEEVLNKTMHLDQLAPRRISEITKVSARPYTPAAQRLLVFKFDTYSKLFRQVSYASIDEDTNNKVICCLRKTGTPPFLRIPVVKKNKINTTITLESMKSIAAQNHKVSFYGVDEELPANRVKEEFGDLESLEDYINDKVIDNKKINYVEIKLAVENYNIDERTINNLSKLEATIIDQNNIFLKRARLLKKIKDINTGDTGILNVYESIGREITEKEMAEFIKNNPDWDLDKINADYVKTYPLLESIDRYHYSNIVEHIAHYINLIDTSSKNQKTTTII